MAAPELSKTWYHNSTVVIVSFIQVLLQDDPDKNYLFCKVTISICAFLREQCPRLRKNYRRGQFLRNQDALSLQSRMHLFYYLIFRLVLARPRSTVAGYHIDRRRHQNAPA